MAIVKWSLFTIISSTLASPARVARQEASTTTQLSQIPIATPTPWDFGAVHHFTVHSSCNRTEAAQINRGLSEAMTLCTHARDHILRWGNSSKIYQKYFGGAGTGEPIGWYEKIVNGDKDGVIFRCDNPDGNCAQEGWAGHWRGENATLETVICPLSYETRKPLEAMCGFGYNVANGPTNFYWASDLLHRLLHVPKVGEGIVEHYAGEYDEVIELPRTRPEEAVRNSDTLQYFALEAYAYDIALPGEGCAGRLVETSSTILSTTATSSIRESETASATSSAAKECHTHSDGAVHCN